MPIVIGVTVASASIDASGRPADKHD